MIMIRKVKEKKSLRPCDSPCVGGTSVECGSTYPRSRSDLSCVLVRRRGSPLPSAATASSSSNGGMMNKSRKLFLDFRLVPTFEALTGPVVSALMVDDELVDEMGWGRSVNKAQLAEWKSCSL
jgi:hypothetical protein